MYKLYLPHVSTSTGKPVFGVVVCGGLFEGVPSGTNYNYLLGECADNTEYFPMIWSGRGKYPMPGPACAGRPLLLLNEPEFREQSNVSPPDAARLLWECRNWTGPLYGFGTQYGERSWIWFQSMMQAYKIAYNEPLPLAGIHIHAYTFGEFYEPDLLRWRALADEHGWNIMISEIGLFPYRATSTLQIAAALPGILDVAIEVLKPTHVFWFTLELNEIVYPDEFFWYRTALRDKFGETVVGKAWSRYTGWRYQL